MKSNARHSRGKASIYAGTAPEHADDASSARGPGDGDGAAAPAGPGAHGLGDVHGGDVDRTHALRDAVDTCLERAVRHCIDLQRPDGSWEVLPDPRIFETALAAHALAHTPGDLDRRAVARGRAWIAAATPQRHHPVAWLIEDTLRRIALRPEVGAEASGRGGADRVVDLTAPELDAPVMASRYTLLHSLALHAGLEVRARISEDELRKRVAGEYERCSQARLKQWSKVELIALHIMLQHRAGRIAAVEAAGFDLVHMQAPRAGFFFNPVSTALAYIALCIAAPASDPWYVLRERLLQDQQPDGSWRFCTSDVWDTSLVVRGFAGHAGFARVALQPALDFLQATQNPDGGWPFRSGVESDNDTTGAVMLALRGTLQGERTVDRALIHLTRMQMDSGLWRTWYFRDDPPVEDVVAHVLSALDAYAGRHRITTEPAREWLAEQVAPRETWAASWYRGTPYAVAEIARALGPGHPLAHRGIDALARTQQDDGGWAADPGGPTTASATGLALMAIAERHPTRVEPALRYLIDTQRADGTWPGTPDMYGPRPMLSHFVTHTQAFVVGGILAALGRG